MDSISTVKDVENEMYFDSQVCQIEHLIEGVGSGLLKRATNCTQKKCISSKRTIKLNIPLNVKHIEKVELSIEIFLFKPREDNKLKLSILMSIL